MPILLILIVLAVAILGVIFLMPSRAYSKKMDRENRGQERSDLDED
jgi:Tfp pilus assembly protein PilE